jgi:hypothetical protein
MKNHLRTSINTVRISETACGKWVATEKTYALHKFAEQTTNVCQNCFKAYKANYKNNK